MGAIRTALFIAAALAEAHAFIPATPGLSLRTRPACATRPRVVGPKTSILTLSATAAASPADESISGGVNVDVPAPVSAEQSREDLLEMARSIFATDERPVILYDGVCNLCNGGVNFMLDFDLPKDDRGTFRFAALQSNVGRALLQRSGRKTDVKKSQPLNLGGTCRGHTTSH